MGEPQYLDPAVDWEGNGWSIEHYHVQHAAHVRERRRAARARMLVPDIATEVPTEANGGITNDGKTYTFHLHKGIKFAPPVSREVTVRRLQVLHRAHDERRHAARAAGDELLHEHRRRSRVQRRQGQEHHGHQGRRPVHSRDRPRASPTRPSSTRSPCRSATSCPRSGSQKWGTQVHPPPAGTGPVHDGPLDLRARSSCSSATPTSATGAATRMPGSTASSSRSPSTPRRRCSS